MATRSAFGATRRAKPREREPMTTEAPPNLDDAPVKYPHEQQAPVVILADVSISMRSVIAKVNDGLRLFHDDVAGDDKARKAVEAKLITFGGSVEERTPWCSIEAFDPPHLTVQGDTPMGEAILAGIAAVEARKKHYRQQGISYHRPMIFLKTDGGPTDMKMGDRKFIEIQSKLREGEQAGKFIFFAVGVDGADMDVLRALCSPENPPVHLEKGNFQKLFRWLSDSMTSVARRQVGNQLQVPLTSS